MTQVPRMTDRAALTRNRSRARQEALFLHEAAADEIEDRLTLVNKSFNDQLLVTGHPEFWSLRFPAATIVPDEDTLALQPASLDLIIHAMALHWANDPVGQIIQSARALRPDGLLLVAAPGGQTLQELRACLAEAESTVSGGLSPRVAPMAEVRDMGGLLQRAGLALPVADTLTLPAEYRDAWHLMRDLRSMGEGNALQDRLRRPTRRAVLDQAADLYASHFTTPSGRVSATFELIFLAGWAPDASQPKPLRPGSAAQRLAEALGTDETKLPN